MIEECEKCGEEYKHYMYPRGRCPNCGNIPIHIIIEGLEISLKTLSDNINYAKEKINQLRKEQVKGE